MMRTNGSKSGERALADVLMPVKPLDVEEEAEVPPPNHPNLIPTMTFNFQKYPPRFILLKLNKPSSNCWDRNLTSQ
jgi:hypothetical protein